MREWALAFIRRSSVLGHYSQSKCWLSISKIASVVDKWRWERSIIWGLRGNWFAEIEAWSLIRERRPPPPSSSLPTFSSLYSGSSVTSALCSNSGHSWALFTGWCVLSLSSCGQWWGVITIGLMADGMLMLPLVAAPIAHRPPGTTQELGGHFHTILHSACPRSPELWLINVMQQAALQSISDQE